MTSEMVAGARPKPSANSLRVTGFRPIRILVVAFCFFRLATLRSLAQTNCRSKLMFVIRIGNRCNDIRKRKQFLIRQR